SRKACESTAVQCARGARYAGEGTRAGIAAAAGARAGRAGCGLDGGTPASAALSSARRAVVRRTRGTCANDAGWLWLRIEGAADRESRREQPTRMDPGPAH